MKRITEYDNITTVSETDVVPIVDVSDTTQASSGSTKKGTIAKIADYIKDRAETLTNKILTTARLNTPKINEDVTVTATSTDINKLDGLTASTAELNKTDGVAGDIVGTTDTQTLTNKTLTDPSINGGDIDSSIRQSIADDDVYSFTPSQSTGFLMVSVSSHIRFYAFIAYRAATTPWINKISGDSDLVTTTGALTGTTSTDAKYTISAHSDGKIYIENRLGGTRAFYFTVIG